MFSILTNDKGVVFPIAIILTLVVTGYISYIVISFEAQINVYNSLEFVNVRATINLLKEIGSI